MDREDICLWADGEWCRAEDLEAMGFNKSDDYEVIPWNSVRAAELDDSLEYACVRLFGHEFWQVINHANMVKICEYLGIEPPHQANWYYDAPTDETADFNMRTVYTEDMILWQHRGHETFANMSREEIIQDWVVCNWASQTDMPAGQYLTYRR